jgi:hypothetical protein
MSDEPGWEVTTTDTDDASLLEWLRANHPECARELEETGVTTFKLKVNRPRQQVCIYGTNE